MAANKSVADALGTDGNALTDSAVNIAGMIGTNTASGAFSSSSVLSNRTGNVMGRLQDIIDQADKCVWTTAAVPSGSAVTIFTVAGGPVEILLMGSICVTANDATAATLKYSIDPTGAIAATDMGMGACGSTANAPVNAMIIAPYGSAVGTTYSATLSAASATVGYIVPAGVITYTVGSGPMTGTWRHFLRYRPLEPGATVTAGF
jgi:hypothetical protein